MKEALEQVLQAEMTEFLGRRRGTRPRGAAVTGRVFARRGPDASPSCRIHTAVSWNAAPPLGQPGSALVSALMPSPFSKWRFGQRPSTTTTPRCWPSRRPRRARRPAPRSIAEPGPGRPRVTPSAAQSCGPQQRGRDAARASPSSAFSVNVELRNVRAGAATSRNGFSAVALSITSRWSGSAGISCHRPPKRCQSAAEVELAVRRVEAVEEVHAARRGGAKVLPAPLVVGLRVPHARTGAASPSMISHDAHLGTPDAPRPAAVASSQITK